MLDVAAGLAAKIEKALGLTAILKEGHAGILEVTFNGAIVYSNQAQCDIEATPQAIIGRLSGLLSKE